MESLIKQLWEGKLCAARLYQTEINVEERCAKLDYHINRLSPTLTEEQRIALTQLITSLEEREKESVERAFILGYKTGVSLTAEAFMPK